jgi:hypothetical protein
MWIHHAGDRYIEMFSSDPSKLVEHIKKEAAEDRSVSARCRGVELGIAPYAHMHVSLALTLPSSACEAGDLLRGRSRLATVSR